MPPSTALPFRNIIYIHTHDMGRYISPYGHAVPTPNLQEFAQRATLFRQAYCCGPTCSPSRAGLLTGETAHQSGMLGLAHRGFSLKDPHKHLAHYLGNHGFKTALCGVQHEFHDAPDQLPYDRLLTTQDNSPLNDAATTIAAINYLKEVHSKPFFLSFGLFYPHRSFKQADFKEHCPDRIAPPPPLPDAPEIRQDMANYHCSVADADNNIGAVLETIQQTGRDKDSLIIITTDHGIPFPEMKCNLTDHGIGVTLIMDFPGNPLRGEASDALISHLDIFPTLCDYLQLPSPTHLQGVSLRPLFEKSTRSIRDAIFSEVNYHCAYEPMRCIRTNRYKLIRRFDANMTRRPSNCDECPSKQLLMDDKWDKDTLPSHELYDLMRDPQEQCNRATDPKLQHIHKELSARLTQWMEATDDPLLHGPVTPPAGAIFNQDEALSATDLIVTVPQTQVD